MKMTSSFYNLVLSLLFGAVSLVSPTPGWAVSIDFVPSDQTVQVGNSTVVDLIVSGLGNNMTPSVGTFDLDVTYDASILAATGVTFGGLLGDGFVTSFQTVDLSTPGRAVVAEVSLLFDFELDALQPASFTLAKLTFETLAVGTSALSFSQALVGDAFGDSLAVTANPGEITAVPEASTLPLLGIGLVCLAAFRCWMNLQLPSNSWSRRGRY